MQFLLNYNRKMHTIEGDGNCLFRCISYYIFGDENQHLKIRSLLVEFMENNPEYFSAHCHPASVSDHTKRMRNNYVWGTHCEIVAAALLFKVPIFVAIRKNNAGPYYWTKFSSESRRRDPQEFHVPEGAEKLANTTSHMEFCHLKDHYNAVLCITTSTLAQTYPYQEDKSSNCCETDVTLD